MPGKAAQRMPKLYASGFNAADAPFLFNPPGAENFHACPFKPLAISAEASGGAVFTDIHGKFSSAELTKLMSPDPRVC